MGKITTTIAIMGGLSVLFYYTGLSSGSGVNTLLSLLLNPTTLSASDLWVEAGLLAGTLLVAAAGTLLTKAYAPDFYLVWPIVVVLAAFGWDMLVVYQQLAASGPVGSMIGVLVFGPLLLIYLIGVIEWWRGVST